VDTNGYFSLRREEKEKKRGRIKEGGESELLGLVYGTRM
jgi:hypothetical protein